MVYKLIGAKENESADDTIIRCANNLLKALIAAGYDIYSTPDISGFDVAVYRCDPNNITVHNILAGWAVSGRCPVKVGFKSKPDGKQLVIDE